MRGAGDDEFPISGLKPAKEDVEDFLVVLIIAKAYPAGGSDNDFKAGEYLLVKEVIGDEVKGDIELAKDLNRLIEFLNVSLS